VESKQHLLLHNYSRSLQKSTHRRKEGPQKGEEQSFGGEIESRGAVAWLSRQLKRTSSDGLKRGGSRGRRKSHFYSKRGGD